MAPCPVFCSFHTFTLIHGYRLKLSQNLSFKHSTNKDSIKFCRKMDIPIGHDGQYAICYKSNKTPDKMEEVEKFRPYGLSVRVDQEKRWVFLRSADLNDIKQCILELGDIYKFSPVKNTKKHQETVDATNVTRVYEVVVLNLPATFAAGRIKELCETIGVIPVASYKHLTKKYHTPYCSVYVRSREDVQTLCKQLNGISYDDKCIIVKDTNNLI